MVRLLFLLALTALAACTGDEPPVDSNPPADDTATRDTAETDSGDVVDTCAARGLTRRTWDASGGTGAFDTLAPAFSAALLDGTTFDWSLEKTGCDTVVSITYNPTFTMAYPDFSRVGDIADWLETSPRNVHYLIWVEAMRDRETTLGEIKPLRTSEWPTRPVCHSCITMVPPSAWTAAVTFFQASTCAASQMSGVNGEPTASGETLVASVMISPADARWA
jgi:hypothetical protein